MKYTCKLYLKSRSDLTKDLVKKVISNLDFAPNKMDVFFNEYSLPKESIPFDEHFLLDNLSVEEMKGVTSFSLYNKEYCNENITPFFRFKLSHVKNSPNVKCDLEWIAYPEIKDHLLLENDNMKNILNNSSLIYCYYYNQGDVWEQTNQEINNENCWGKRLVVKGFDFMAAPLMYFGEECNDAIPFNTISSFSLTEKKQINSKEILKVSLFGIHEAPEKNRKNQKNYWEDLGLKSLSDKYKEKNKIDFTAFLKKRASANKK